MNNLTSKQITPTGRVLVKPNDIIPVKTNNPISVENMKVISKHGKVLTCDDGSGFERSVVFRKKDGKMYFELIND